MGPASGSRGEGGEGVKLAVGLSIRSSQDIFRRGGERGRKDECVHVSVLEVNLTCVKEGSRESDPHVVYPCSC